MRSLDPFIVLSVAGSDPTGGAGIQGDLKTFATHGVHGTAVVAAVTVQNANGVRAIHAIPPPLVAAQMETLFEQAAPRAMKTGMLHSPETVAAVAGVLARWPVGNLVVDPVLAATSGGALAEPGLLDAMRSHLVPLARLVTPNRAEASALLHRRIDDADAEPAARALLAALGCGAVLLKGGHARGPATDVLATRDWVLEFTLPRIETPHGHGTGCALSAAITARLALGADLPQAVQGAKAWVYRGLASAVALGSGRGCVDHSAPLEQDAP